jgi:hypothetical protein
MGASKPQQAPFLLTLTTKKSKIPRKVIMQTAGQEVLMARHLLP